MPYQTGRNSQINFKVESAFNTPPGASGATGFRPTSGGGLNLRKRTFASGEVRKDGLSVMGRHGSRSVEGTLNSEMSLGTHDAFLEAIIRDTWGATLSASQADFTSITTGANTIVAASGSFITKGFRVGDVVRLGTHSQAANNNKNLRCTALSASTMTVAETLVVDAAPDSTFTLSRGKKLTRLAGTALVDRTFTFEEYNGDIDATELYSGVSISSARIQVSPNGMVMITYGLVGADGTALVSGSSPYFTSPTISASLPMVAADAKLSVNGVDVVDLTSLDITLAVNSQGAEVVGSYVTPAMFTNQLAITGNFSCLRSDLSRLSSFIAEDRVALTLMMVENEAEPKDHISIVLPSIKFDGVDKNEFGANGPRIETIPIMVGYDPTRTSEYDATSISIVTSAP